MRLKKDSRKCRTACREKRMYWFSTENGARAVLCNDIFDAKDLFTL